jgi:glyoxylase-like metal-dependent hydrolase (beta-lactamase superfamily II)
MQPIADTPPEAAPPGTISAAELAQRLADDDSPALVDVRDPEDFASGHIPAPTALNIPADDVLSKPGSVAAELEGSRDAIVVCQAGRRALTVREALAGAGVEASVLAGGMAAWSTLLRAFPVELRVPGLTVLQIQRPGRGCLSYLLTAGGDALVVDPTADASFYERLASEQGAVIRHVVDTHLHADHVSVARELAGATGATLRVSTALIERGVSWADEASMAEDGDTLMLGDVPLRWLALPGHTTDMTGLVVSDAALIGGDSIFADSVARPDLEMSDPEGTREMARRLHATLRERVLKLGPDAVLLPGHYAGGALSAALAPTLREVRERLPELELDDSAFADAILANMPPRPANYAEIIDVNAGRAAPDPSLEIGANNCAVS